ncbi:hypothetical protein [Marinimicrobium sp. ABcell2]|uniref:hypothetical protein n=1 Tax=Marinimicrobium sp. ABcell2 TaxID=3069751 RepID=UPI0027AF7CFC|nr:hypothetical protein [Marinimicrobium sp. ABcell2]MDQ2077443.1 hypothetical protein [Marinimicrobium sp. ABcell2]
MDTTFKAKATAILSPILSILIVVAIGIYASVRAEKLNSAFPFSCIGDASPCMTFSAEAGLFYVAVLILALVVIVQIKSQVRRQLETEELLEETRALVRTAPPKQLLRFVNFRYVQVQDTLAWLEAKEDVDDQDLTFAIRAILNNMLRIAQYWDTHLEDGSEATYRATVMLVVQASNFESPKARQALLREIRFADRNALAQEQGFKHFPWYARTAVALNTSTTVKPRSIDRTIQPLILGVTPKLENMPNPQRIMPGAPSCLYDGLPQYIANTSAMVNMLNGAYFGPLHSEIEDYYDRDGLARSLLSMPLLVGRGAKAKPWTETSCPYIGVVNIFCDESGMFGSTEASEQYSHLVAPFRDELGILLASGLENDVDFNSY